MIVVWGGALWLLTNIITDGAFRLGFFAAIRTHTNNATLALWTLKIGPELISAVLLASILAWFTRLPYRWLPVGIAVMAGIELFAEIRLRGALPHIPPSSMLLDFIITFVICGIFTYLVFKFVRTLRISKRRMSHTGPESTG